MWKGLSIRPFSASYPKVSFLDHTTFTLFSVKMLPSEASQASKHRAISAASNFHFSFVSQVSFSSYYFTRK